MIKRIAFYLVLTVALGGCAAPINRHTATNYYQAGEIAMNQGNLPHAREMFSRALINARLGNMGSEAEGQVLSKLGRVYGNMCQHDEAEKAFTEAIAAYSNAFGASSPRTFPIRMELAQFSYDIGRYGKATAYFDQAFPIGVAVLEKSDPVGFIAVMKDYADALEKMGEIDRSRQASLKIKAIEAKESAAKIAKTTDYVRYPSTCR